MSALGGEEGSDVDKQLKVSITQWFGEIMRQIQSHTVFVSWDQDAKFRVIVSNLTLLNARLL